MEKEFVVNMGNGSSSPDCASSEDDKPADVDSESPWDILPSTKLLIDKLFLLLFLPSFTDKIVSAEASITADADSGLDPSLIIRDVVELLIVDVIKLLVVIPSRLFLSVIGF